MQSLMEPIGLSQMPNPNTGITDYSNGVRSLSNPRRGKSRREIEQQVGDGAEPVFDRCADNPQRAWTAAQDALSHRILGKRAGAEPQRGFTSTFTKFWLVGARGKMSGPESPPIGGLGEASWAFEVMLVVVPAVVVPSIVPDAVGDV
jgi:hypothetical protein